MADEPDGPNAPEISQALLDAFIQHELMDETASYLSRGRSLHQLDDEAVKLGWTAAFKRWTDKEPNDQIKLEDWAAELRIRNIDPPLDRVSNELDAMRRKVRQPASGELKSGELRHRIAEFQHKREHPDS
jgi:hypothetical protein